MYTDSWIMEFIDISRGIYRNDSTCILVKRKGYFFFFFFLLGFFLQDVFNVLEELKRESIECFLFLIISYLIIFYLIIE